jgi:hypothetical protein
MFQLKILERKATSKRTNYQDSNSTFTIHRLMKQALNLLNKIKGAII